MIINQTAVDSLHYRQAMQLDTRHVEKERDRKMD
jgi:hypothetical protein